MMRELASRMPAQKAADRPTGPGRRLGVGATMVNHEVAAVR